MATARNMIKSDTMYDFLEKSFLQIINTLKSEGKIIVDTLIAEEGQTAIFMGNYDRETIYTRTATQIPVVFFQSHLYYQKSVGSLNTDPNPDKNEFNPEYWVKKDIQFELFKDQADFDGTILVPTYKDDEDAQKKNFGLFRFLGGTVDPSRIMNVYLQRFSLEVLAFESYRDDIKTLLTTFASSLDGTLHQLSDSNGTFTVALTVTEFPVISETIDANGADKFISSLLIDLLVYEDLVHADGIVFKVDGVRIPFSSISFNRQMIEPVPDLEKAFENRYVPTKSTHEVSVSGLYQLNTSTGKLMNWLFDETNLKDVYRVFYTDRSKVFTKQYLLSNFNLTVEEGQLLAYSFKLLPYFGATQFHYGVLVKNGIGTDEYVAGTVVTVNTEDSNFTNWVVESGQTLEASEGTTLNDSTFKFIMPEDNVIIRANTAE